MSGQETPAPIICSKCVEPWEGKVICSIKEAMLRQRAGAKVTIYISPEGEINVQMSINKGKQRLTA